MLTCRNDKHDDDDDDYRTSHGGNGEGDSPLPSALPRQLVHDPIVQREVDADRITIIIMMVILPRQRNDDNIDQEREWG